MSAMSFVIIKNINFSLLLFKSGILCLVNGLKVNEAILTRGTFPISESRGGTDYGMDTRTMEKRFGRGLDQYSINGTVIPVENDNSRDLKTVVT